METRAKKHMDEWSKLSEICKYETLPVERLQQQIESRHHIVHMDETIE